MRSQFAQEMSEVMKKFVDIYTAVLKIVKFSIIWKVTELVLLNYYTAVKKLVEFSLIFKVIDMLSPLLVILIYYSYLFCIDLILSFETTSKMKKGYFSLSNEKCFMLD